MGFVSRLTAGFTHEMLKLRSPQVELDDLAIDLQRVHQEVDKRLQMFRKQLGEWRKLGYHRNKWHLIVSAFSDALHIRRHGGEQPLEHEVFVTNMCETTYVDEDQSGLHDLTLVRLKV
jgi:hypothetical protein